MSAELWFDGVYLLGQFNPHKTGCWLLVNGGEAAVLEMPPASPGERSPADAAAEAAASLGAAVKLLLCTHAHLDTFNRQAFNKMRAAFPDAVAHLHAGFRQQLGGGNEAVPGIHYFDDSEKLSLAGEPLFLIHAPKHSATDTVLVFRGAACLGDWELETLRSANDGLPAWAVPKETKLRSIDRLERFCREENYGVHRTFSVHATDRRERVDFPALLARTRQDRPLPPPASSS
jgi:glyoxylase-like metal-dependent hydrolase (beta-lactamase superfamily II)